MTLELFEMALSPPCRAVKVLAKRIGLDLKLTNVDLLKKEQLEPDFLKINPFHTLPVFKDEDFHLFESRAIMVYLVNKYASDSNLYPKDVKERALVDAMLYYDIGTLGSSLIGRVHSINMTGKDVSEDVLQRGKDNLKCLDNVLSTRMYVAGDHLTLADISIIHTLSVTDALEDDLSEYSHLEKYRALVRQDLGEYFVETNDSTIEIFKEFLKSKITV